MTDTPPPFVPYVPGPQDETHAAAVQQPAPPAAPPAPRPSRAVLVGVISGLAVVLLAAGGFFAYTRLGGNDEAPAATAANAGPSKRTAYTVSGSMTVVDSYPASGACSGKGGFSDMHEGTQVAVLDSARTTIALGALGPGHIAAAGCVFEFTVSGVPVGKGFYEVAVGPDRRGGIKYPESDLSNGYPVVLSLG